MAVKTTESLYALTPLQQGMLVHSLQSPHSGIYVQQLICRLGHQLNASEFQRAWQKVVDRHSVLRTSFRWEGLEEAVQEVSQKVELPFEIEDWTSLPQETREDLLTDFLETDRRKGFDFTKAPLMRLSLFRFDENDYRLVWTSHHALMDGRSRLQVLKEVFAIYEGARADLPEPRPYRDYVEWLQSRDLSRAEPYWRQLLHSFKAHNTLVASKKASSHTSDSFGNESFGLSPVLTSTLLSIAQWHEITLNTIVQGCWSILLSRYSDQADVVFGTIRAVHWTEQDEARPHVGLFINTLPVRANVEHHMSVVELLKQLRQQTLALREHEHTPLVKLQEWSELAPGMPLFETIVIFENYQLGPFLRSQGGEWTNRDFELLERTNYPLALSVYADYNEPSLLLKLTYDRNRLDDSTVQHMSRQLHTLLESIAANPEQRISELRWMNDAERQRIAVEWNATEAEYPNEHLIHQFVELQSERTPEADAVIFENERLTYGELNSRANQLGRYLRKLGVGPEVRVAVSMERSPALIVALLGILKAGGAYIPIEHPAPEQRLLFMLHDSHAHLLLTQQHLLESLPDIATRIVCVDSNWAEIEKESAENLPATVGAENAATVIYTSGSTGTPKGVLSSHRAFLNRFAWMWHAYPFAAGEVCCQKTSLSFVDSVWEIFGPLTHGVPLVIIPNATVRDPLSLMQTLAAHRVTRLVLAPSLLAAIIETTGHSMPAGIALRYCVCSGETLPVELAAAFRRRFPNVTLINLYGSTEVAADVTCYEVEDAQHLERVPIGRPISNTQIYILDADFGPAPLGLVGEIYAGGAGLAREYLNRPEMTAERFVPDPFAAKPGARLFRTGDLGRYLPDGNIEYLGRRDHQVKVRGFRIELGEIEAVVSAHPQVRNCIVMASDNNSGDRDLIAFIVPDGT